MAAHPTYTRNGHREREPLHEIECLGCGATRMVALTSAGRLASGDCSDCGNVGWARPADLTDSERQILQRRRCGTRFILALTPAPLAVPTDAPTTTSRPAA